MLIMNKLMNGVIKKLYKSVKMEFCVKIQGIYTKP
jgi:hypothetical protein